MIEVLRLSHRIRRDPRLTTHVTLTARALLASKLYYSGDRDKTLEETINKITKQFGGNFIIEYTKDPIKLIKEKKKQGFTIVHLTVYGRPFNEKLNILKDKNLLIIIGGEKVPSEYYHLADYNLSVTSQPHSELSALAILLYLLNKNKKSEFKNAKLKIIPQEKGKLVRSK